VFPNDTRRFSPSRPARGCATLASRLWRALTAALRRVPEFVGKPADTNRSEDTMSKTNLTILNALRTLFGARAASSLYKRTGGRASQVLEEARATYGRGWDAIRAVHTLTEQAFLETSAAEIIDSPAKAASFLTSKLAGIGYEVFTVLFLNAKQRIVACEELFRGTLTQTSVYPREVVRRALTLNSSCVILCHNHPSGETTASRADQILTRELQAALKLIDVQVLDHIIVAAGNSSSMAQLGLL
jgi:DNA repair protein RadC